MAFDFGPLILFFLRTAMAGFSQRQHSWLRSLCAWHPVCNGSKIWIVPVVTAESYRVRRPDLWLHDETFIKMKPTIIYSIFAAILFAGLDWGLFEPVLDGAFHMTEEGWRKLTAVGVLFWC